MAVWKPWFRGFLCQSATAGAARVAGWVFGGVPSACGSDVHRQQRLRLRCHLDSTRSGRLPQAPAYRSSLVWSRGVLVGGAWVGREAVFRRESWKEMQTNDDE